MIKAPVPCQISGERTQVTFKPRNIPYTRTDTRLTVSLQYSLRRAKMALQPVPTKEEFLATGLEPLQNEDCPICMQPMTDPVTVNCNGKHVFCRECIVRYLQGLEAGTCPLCRQRLFAPDPNDEIVLADPRPRLLRDQRINTAFRQSGLGHLLLPYQQQNYAPSAPAPPNDFITFHNEISWSRDQMQLDASMAHTCLALNWRTMPIGAHTVDANTLGSALITMGNVLMSNAAADQRTWSLANVFTWAEIVVDIWQNLSQYDGSRMYTETMYRNLMASLLDKYYFGADPPSPFFQQGPLLRDLRMLVLYAVSRSGEWMEWRSPIDRPRAKNIRVPLVYPCTASEPARLRAERWMAEVYVRN